MTVTVLDKGMKSSLARSKSVEVVRLAVAGLTPQQITKDINIGIASVYRILAQHKAVA